MKGVLQASTPIPDLPATSLKYPATCGPAIPAIPYARKT